MKTLVTFYSWSCGNTQRIAEMVAAALGADLDIIRTVEPYPQDYDRTVEQAQREVNAGFRPALEPPACDPARYDRIVIGTPTWWYTMAPAVATYLAAHDWTGKIVVPFSTHAGWPGHVLGDIANACVGARIERPFDVRFDSSGESRMITSAGDVERWIATVAAARSR